MMMARLRDVKLGSLLRGILIKRELITSTLFPLLPSSQQFAKLSSALLEKGFTQSYSDSTLFVKIKGSNFLAILIYVDDILVASNNDTVVTDFKPFLSSKFQLKDPGPLKYFLGIEVARSRKGITIFQRNYALELLKETGTLGSKPRNIPLDPGLKLSKEEREILSDPTVYRRLIGKLIYLTITRPDLSFAVNKLSQYMDKPQIPHHQAALQSLHYIKPTLGQGLFFSASSPRDIQAFVNADWATCPNTRRSVTGFCIFIGNSLVS